MRYEFVKATLHLSMLLAATTAAGSYPAHAGGDGCQWMFSSAGIGNFQNLAKGPPLIVAEVRRLRR